MRKTVIKSQKQKEEIKKYIMALMVLKGWNQSDLAARCGKTQSWFSKKMEHCGFYVGELIEIFILLDAKPEDIGKVMLG